MKLMNKAINWLFGLHLICSFEPVSAGITAAASLASGLIGASKAKKERKRKAKAKVVSAIQKKGQREGEVLQDVVNNLRASVLG